MAQVHGSPEGSATMAQYLLRQQWLLCPIPDDVPYERAALACCALGPSYGAYERMGVGATDAVLITGAGPVGLGAVVNALFRNARAIVVEGGAYRAERARRLGATAVLDPADPDVPAQVRELTGGRGADAAVDCSGVPEAQRVCIDATRRRGNIAFVGECSDRKLEIAVSPDMIRKGLTLHGSWHYNLSQYPGVMDVIRRSPLAGELVSHTLPMTRIQEAMELSASQQCAKVLLQPWH
jgi:threonine dehydrogenase-like Zn-dependent dehydrogenase